MDLTKPISMADLTKPLIDPPIVIPAPLCSKCGGKMEDGFILDKDHSGASISNWVAGKPEYSLFGQVKAPNAKQNEIHTFACLDCGYFDSYIRRPRQSPPA
jgi:hypothetical protein